MEYQNVMLSEAAKFVKWLRNITKELGENLEPTIIRFGSNGSINWAHDWRANNNNQRKHKDVGYNFMM